MKQPSWSILDRSKPWTPSYATDVSATFRKYRERMEAEQRVRDAVAKVKPIRRIECNTSAPR